MLGVEHARRDGPRVERVIAQRVRCDLAVEHVRRDVRVVRRDLSPALGAVVGADADERDPLVAEALDARDPVAAFAHGTITFRMASPRRMDSIASLIRSSGWTAVTNSSSLSRPSR